MVIRLAPIRHCRTRCAVGLASALVAASSASAFPSDASASVSSRAKALTRIPDSIMLNISFRETESMEKPVARSVEVIAAPGVPVSHLPFSPAVRVGDLVFVSGQASVDAGGAIVKDSFEGEFRRSIETLSRDASHAASRSADGLIRSAATQPPVTFKGC